MRKEIKEKVNVRGTLISMKLKSKVTFPINRASSIRTTCSLIGLETGKKFATKTSRAENSITVTRIK